MNLGLEALNTDVEGFDLGDMSASIESIVIDLHDAIYQINEAGNDVEALIGQQARLEGAMEQLEDIKAVITKSGVTPALLDIVNDKGQLARALEIEIPSMFVDEAARGAASQACLEALNIKANLGKAWIAVKKFFLEMIKRVKDFIKRLIDGTTLHLRALKKYKAVFEAQSMDYWDAKAFSDTKINGITPTAMDSCIKGLGLLKNALEGGKDGAQMIEAVATALSDLGWDMDVKTGTLSNNSTFSSKQPKEDKIGKLGFSIIAVRDYINEMITALGSVSELQSIQRKLETKLQSGARMAELGEKGGDNDAAKEKRKDQLKEEKTAAIASARALSKYGETANRISVQLISMASKAKKNADKK